MILPNPTSGGFFLKRGIAFPVMAHTVHMKTYRIFETRPKLGAAVCGGIAGIANGLLGAGGGMLLIPLLRAFHLTKERELFATAIAVMLPISLVSFLVYLLHGSVNFGQALPYCIGGLAGGLLGGLFYQKIPTVWLHRALGVLILWGGVRLLF